MLISIWKKYKYQLLLVISVLVILYPLSLFIYVPKWDNINGYLPYRYFISDYLWNGHLPLWNPFQQLGYPGYADLQSGVWNPIVWIIMLFGKYTINSLIVELLSCYVIAGLGMFKLAKYLYNCEKTALIIALSYALSGFMVGSSQLMVFLIAVAWFPWVIYALLQFFKTYQLKYQLLTAFFIALFVTGASPAYTIVLAYIIVGMFVYQLVLKRSSKKQLLQLMVGGITTLFVLVLLIAPYINSFLEFSPYFNRGDKLGYDKFLLSNPFTPISYLSFLLPDAIISKSDWFNITDLSLRNGYFGLLGFAVMLSSVLSKLTRTKIILYVLFCFSLLLAAGGEIFIFEYLYHLPGFGVFRHPSIFRAFTIFCGLLIGGYEIKELLEEGVKKRHKLVFSAILVLLVIAGVWAISKTSFSALRILIIDVINFVEFSESALSTHILLNVSVALILIIGSFYLMKVFKTSLFVSLLLFVLLDFGIHTRISTPTTVCYPIKQDGFAKFFKKLPQEISQKDNTTPLKKLDENQGLIKTGGIWRNVSTYNKTLSFVGENPMRFKTFDLAKKNGVLEKTIEHPILYFQKGEAILKNPIVGYNTFEANIENTSNKNQLLLLNQNYHHQWSAFYNDKKLPAKIINNLIIGVEIPENSKGKILFKYLSPKTPYLMVLSVLTYLLLLGLFLYQKFRGK